MEGKSIPQAMDILPKALTRDNIAQYEADLADPASVYRHQERRDVYLKMYGNIFYDMRDRLTPISRIELSNGSWRQAELLELLRPFGWSVAELSDSNAARQAAVDGGLDQAPGMPSRASD